MTCARQLLRKYDRPGPRYTSYPPITYWNETPTQDSWLAHLNKSKDPVSVYIHVPFCRTLCFYCGCHTIVTKDSSIAQRYVTLLQREWTLYKAQLDLKSRGGILLHVGGGTPTFLSPKLMEMVFVPMFECFETSQNFEFSIEADPRSTTIEKLTLLRELGCSRISFGVQDFELEVQKRVNRIQPYELVAKVVDDARKVGMRSVNFDLLYGLPGQTIQSVIDTAKRTINLRPDRIAWYGYAHVPWMKPAQAQWSEADLPSGETKRALYDAGREILLEAGYREIGMDHFALPDDSLSRADKAGTLSRNFMGYVPKRQLPLLGLGISAIGEAHGMFIQNQKSLNDYQQQLEADTLPIMRGHTLSQEDVTLRDKIIEILAQKRTSLKDVAPFVLENLRELQHDGLVEIDQEHLRVTTLGIPLIRVIAAAFDQYGSRDVSSQFSKVI